MRIAVIGAGGRLGGAFVRVLGQRHELLPVTRRELELGDTEALWDFAETVDADWVVNCAAISGLEACLDDPLTAHQVNAVAPELLAGELHRRGVAFLHVSTDYVLDGRHAGKKSETQACKPVNVYGQSKLEAELRVCELSPSAWVSRISWIFGPDGRSFPHQVIERAIAGETQPLIADKYSLPTFADDFVLAWERLAEMRVEGGVYQFCNQGEPVSWFGMAEEILAMARELGAPVSVDGLQRLTLKDASFFRDSRPLHTAMDPAKVEALLGHAIRPWQAAMREHLEWLGARDWRI